VGTFTGAVNLEALFRTSRPPTVIAIGDRRGRVRDAAARLGAVALSIDMEPSESARHGLHYMGDFRDLIGVQRKCAAARRCIIHTFLPCEQQAVVMGSTTAVAKALDGRMFAGMMQWLRGWCLHATAMTAEQPNSYLMDFYDAPHHVTSYTQWGTQWRKTLALACRGAAPPEPTTPLSEGSLEWHDRAAGSGRARSHARDETPHDLAEALARLEPVPGHAQPQWRVERERLAAAWYLAFGFCPPYDTEDGRPAEDEAREYALSRGAGDGRRVRDGAIPRLLLSEEERRRNPKPALDSLLRGVAVPVVTARGLALARLAKKKLVVEEASVPASEAVRVVDVDDVRAHTVVVIPVRREAGALRFLAQVQGRGLIGAEHASAAGSTGGERKEATAVARRLTACVLVAPADDSAESGARVAPVRYYDDVGGGGGGFTVAVHAAWVPGGGATLGAGGGLAWLTAAQLGAGRRRELCAAVAWRADAWRSPQRDLIGGRVGAFEPAPTIKHSFAGSRALDRGAAVERLERDLEDLRLRLLDAADEEPHVAAQLRQWASKIEEENAVRPPPSVAACARAPDVARFAGEPFVRRCCIPQTEHMEPRWPPPRWPPGVPRPRSAAETYRPEWRGPIAAKLDELAAWTAKRTAEGRPKAAAWSDEARLPWLRGRIMSFADGECALLGAGGPAAEGMMDKAAALSTFASFKHQRLVSYIVQGVRLGDTLPCQTVLAGNLLSLFEVDGGADAVVEELHKLKQRGWYQGSADCGGGKRRRLLTSPARICPRGAVPRKDGGPPRGVAEEGFPRVDMATEDNGEQVDSLNNSSGAREGLGGPLRDIYPLDEGKPRAGDAQQCILVMWSLAQLIGVSVILLLFDYKYFFHCLVYEMAEVWKMGFALPARAAEGGAHATLLDVLLEKAMAMGWTRASLIAQDLANGLVWREGRDSRDDMTGLVRRLRDEYPEFDAVWRKRLQIPHDDYGTHATLVESLQYTDDKLTVACGPEAAAIATVAFVRIVGPPLYVSDDAREAARGTVRRHAALLRGDAICPAVGPRPSTRVRTIAAGETPAAGARVVRVARGTPGGNPFESSDARAAVTGYACLLACGRDNVCVHEVAALRGLRVHAAQARAAADALWDFIDELTGEVEAGGSVAIDGRDAAVSGGAHADVLAQHVQQRLDIADDERRGPPTLAALAGELPEVRGLGLEAAKVHKWHVGGAAVWIGKGFDANLLVRWVQQHKAAAMIVGLRRLLDERLEVSEYRSLLGQLADEIESTGGGWYRLKGMSAPLLEGQELSQGPATVVRRRRQLWARATAWLSTLSSCPGSSMLASTLPAPKPKGGVVWEIGGDGAREPGDKLAGIGAYWYGIWWHVPLVEGPPGMERLHITCIELLEVGLGVVIVGGLLLKPRHVRLVSDAYAAAATMRTRLPSGGAARDSKSKQLAAVHEVILRSPEFAALGEPEVVQNYGETLLLNDAASRGYAQTITDVSAANGVTAHRLHPLPPRAWEYLREAVNAAMDAMTVDDPVAGAAGCMRDPLAHLGEPPDPQEVIRFMADLIGAALRVAAGSATVDARRRARSGWVAGGSGAHQAADAISEELARAVASEAPGPPAAAPGSPEDAPVWKSRAAAARKADARPNEAAKRKSVYDAAPLRQQQCRSATGVGATRRDPPSTALAKVVAAPVGRRPIAEAARAAVTAARGSAIVVASSADGVDNGLAATRAMLLERSMCAARSDEDGLGVTGAADDLLRRLLGAALLATEQRFARSTRRKDKGYFAMWTEWCELIGTPPLRTNVAANTGAIPRLYEREVAVAMGAFMYWVGEHPEYKAESMLARLRGVARRHAAHQLKFVSLAAVVAASQGLIREEVDDEGPEVLIPKSREPFRTEEIVGMLTLPTGTVVKWGSRSVTVGDNLPWQGVVVWINLYATMGLRKEGIALGPDEVFGPRKLSLWHVTHLIDGILRRAPTVPQLRAARWGTITYITPCPCKNDQDGTKYMNNPTPSRWHETRVLNLSRELIKYELMRQVGPELRRMSPLVLSPSGASWTKAELDKFFKALVSLVVPPERARQLSVHSFRVWLACALLAAGATPEQIMLLLRWSSDAARKLYAQLGTRRQASLLEAAADVPLDSIRGHTLLTTPVVGPPTEEQAEREAAGRAVRDALELLERSHAQRGELPPPTDIGVPIDEWAAMRQVADERDDLKRFAERADARLRTDAGAGSDHDSDGD
jgi:hypothetical protein